MQILQDEQPPPPKELGSTWEEAANTVKQSGYLKDFDALNKFIAESEPSYTIPEGTFNKIEQKMKDFFKDEPDLLEEWTEFQNALKAAVGQPAVSESDSEQKSS
jgi:PAB1-binding protein PBP1